MPLPSFRQRTFDIRLHGRLETARIEHMWRENEREEGDGLSFGVHLVVFFLCVPRARSFSPEGIFGEWPPREQLAAQLRCIAGCHAEEILRHLGSDFRLPLHTPTDKLTHKHTPVCDSFAAKHRQPFVALDRPSNRFFFFLQSDLGLQTEPKAPYLFA